MRHVEAIALLSEARMNLSKAIVDIRAVAKDSPTDWKGQTRMELWQYAELVDEAWYGVRDAAERETG